MDIHYKFASETTPLHIITDKISLLRSYVFQTALAGLNETEYFLSSASMEKLVRIMELIK